MIFFEREALYFPILVAAFVRQGLPPEWGVALARQESAFVATAINNSTGDASRGGSRGLCQMSLLTARGLGFTGPPEELMNPICNADLAALLCKEISTRLKTTELGDVAAAYNSGKVLAKAPASTRNVYVPRVLSFALGYKLRARAMAEAMAKQIDFSAPAPQQLPLPNGLGG